MPEITFIGVKLVVDGREVVANFNQSEDIRCMLDGVIQLGPFLRALAEPPKVRPPEGGERQ